MKLPSASSRFVSVLLFLTIVLFGGLALSELNRDNAKTASQLLAVSAAGAALLAIQIGYLAVRSMGQTCVSRKDTALFLLLVLVLLAAPITLFALALSALKASDAGNRSRATSLISDLIIIGTVSAFVVIGPPPNLFKE